MIVFLAPSTLWNPSVLETRRVPKRVVGRPVTLLPRGWGVAAFWRHVFEHQFLRYMVALLPFLVALALWPELALPISQAPLLMFLAIWLAESRWLAVQGREARAALIDPVEAARVLDLFQDRARRCLTRIAAARGLTAGRLHLVVDQSELARVAPLTFVSLQLDGARAQVLDTSPEERALLAGLFDADLSERLLHTVNLSQNQFLREVALETAGISGHARLAARMARP